MLKSFGGVPRRARILQSKFRFTESNAFSEIHIGCRTLSGDTHVLTNA